MAIGFVGFFGLFHFMHKKTWRTRQPTRLLVTEIERYTDRDGGRFAKPHYLVLDGEHAGTRAVSTMGSSPPNA